MAPHVAPSDAPTEIEADVVAAAVRLIPQVLAAREECETLRHVPPHMVEAHQLEIARALALEPP